MIGETILARTSAQCKQAYNWRDNISLIIGLQSASWWSVNIYCANYWPTIGAPIIVPPILARLSAVLLNSANPTWVSGVCTYLFINFWNNGLPWVRIPRDPGFRYMHIKIIVFLTRKISLSTKNADKHIDISINFNWSLRSRQTVINIS